MSLKKFLKEGNLWQEDCPGVPQTGIILARAFIKQNSHLGAKLQKRIAILVKNDYLWEITSIDEKKGIFEALHKKGLPFLEKMILEWVAQMKKCESRFSRLESMEEMPGRNLAEEYKKFLDDASDLWSYPIMCEGFDYFTTNEVIPLVSAKLNVNKNEAREIAIAMSRPGEKSYMEIERLSLLKISLLKSGFDIALEKHAKEYFWIRNNYLKSCVMGKVDFLAEVKEIRKMPREEVLKMAMSIESYEAGAEREKSEIIEKYCIGKELLALFRMLERASWWIDRRKAMMLRLFHYLFAMLDEAGRRGGYDEKLIRYAHPSEVYSILNGRKVQNSLLEKRRQGFAYMLDADFNEEFIAGKEANELIGSYLGTLIGKEIKGITASGKGTISGRASIVLDIAKDRFRKGDILVTSMTRPEFLPLMRKAKAIVADEGGLTCHAAIVARELRIPCIIGTRTAVRNLKTGDNITMDLETGRIRKDD